MQVTAMESDCTIKGWLQRLVNRSWKKMWFVLKEQVLYAYKASEDVVAIETTPVLGFCVERPVSQSKHFEKILLTKISICRT